MPPISARKREQMRLASQRYNKAHREERRAYAKAYYAAHPEEQRASDNAYRAAHREELRASAKAYHAAHREARLTYHKAYMAANPDIARAGVAHRRALKLSVPSTLTTTQWKAIVVAYKGRCAYCGAKPKKLTQDHVTPLSRGGHHTAENVVPSCWPCNSRKHTGPPPLIPSLRLLL